MEDRFEKILGIAKATLGKKSDETKNTEVGKWMDKYYHSNWWDKLKGFVINKGFNAIFSSTKSGLARNVTEMAVKWVLTDLDKKGFLKKVKDK
jgi:hypothetical protein